MKGIILTVVVALSSLPTNLNPFYLNLEGHTPIQEMLYASPLRMDGKGELKPYVAEIVSRGEKEVVLKVRRGFFWEGGKPITPEDLAYTYNFLANYRKNPFYPYWKGIKAKAEGNEVLIRFPHRPQKYHFLYPVLPQKYSPPSPVPFSGPYKVTRASAGMIFLRRRSFPLKTAFTRIKLIQVKDPAVLKMKLEAGEADIAVASRFYLPSRGFRVYRISRPAFLYLGFRGLNRYERCWIAQRLKALNFSSITRGFSRRIDSPFQLWFPLSGEFSCMGKPPGRILELIVASSGRERLMLAQIIQSALGKVRIIPLERGIFLRRLRSGNFQIALSAFSLDFPLDLKEVLSCHGAVNYFGYCNRAMDIALQEEEWEKAHSIFLKDLPLLPLYSSQYPLVVRESIKWQPFTLSFSSASPFRSIIEE